MYGKKVQLAKKKPAKSSGSNWGPRIALYEREQQQRLEEATAPTSQAQYVPASGTGSSIYGKFKNPCAINGGRSISLSSGSDKNSSSKSQSQYFPAIGKYGYIRNTNSNGKQQLKVIIPPPEQFHYEANGSGIRKIHPHPHLENDSLPSTETWRSSDHDDDSQLNSMTRTTVVPSDDDEDNDIGVDDNQLADRGEYEALCKCESPENRKFENSAQIHRRTSPYSSTSATAAALAHGFSMVYVPMENVSVRRSKLLSSNSDVDEKNGHTHAHTPTAHSEASRSSPTTTNKDPDNDSLLESFDSVIFKPKSSPQLAGASKLYNGSSKMTPEQRPPPLPPKNVPGSGTPLPNGKPNSNVRKSSNGSGNGNGKSIRFADNLIVKRNSSRSPPCELEGKVRAASQPQNEPTQRAHISNPSSCGGGSGGNSAEEKLGSSTPLDLNCDDDANFTHAYTACKSAATADLMANSCGHARHADADSYSTISSIQSEVGDADIQTPSKVSQKSALQQLRDLSILIGGSFHTPEDVEQTALSLTSPGDSEIMKSRKSSDAVSADSGKGSANDASNSNSVEGAEPPNSNCSCADDVCIFRPECEECQMFFKNPFEKSPNLYGDDGGGYGEVKSRRSKSSKKGHHKLVKKTTSTNSTPTPSSKLGKQPLLILPPDNCNCLGCGGGGGFEPKFPNGCGSKGLTKTQFLLRKSEGLLFPKKFKHGHHASKRSPGGNSNSSSGNFTDPTLFTIDEEASVIAEDGIMAATNMNNNSTPGYQKSTNFDLGNGNGNGDQEQHFHPKCWLAPDATMGWSDLESLYSQNLKSEQPMDVNGECWTCWREMSQFKYNSPDSNRTIDRTKRMFIWLNKRPKEFNAPWWEAKKQASIKWLAAKAYAHLPSNAVLQDPFRPSKRDKIKFRLREEIIVGLANGKLYCMALDNLYQKNREKRCQGLSHWEIIKILSRRGVYVAQPSDMKWTEGTLRQKKPLKIAAHIALIEAIMGLYAKELVTQERILPILRRLGQELNPDAETPEQLIISWINSAINTTKSYILANTRNKSLKLTSAQVEAWLRVPPVGEIRDLSDGIGICCLLALYFSSDLSLEEIGVGCGGIGPGGGEAEETLSIYEMIVNHTLVQKMCGVVFPEKIYHLCVTDFLYIHGYMKQNILSFLIDLFYHLEVNPIVRVNLLTHVPLRVQL